jgi:hypothetical protein
MSLQPDTVLAIATHVVAALLREIRTEPAAVIARAAECTRPFLISPHSFSKGWGRSWNRSRLGREPSPSKPVLATGK